MSKQFDTIFRSVFIEQDEQELVKSKKQLAQAKGNNARALANDDGSDDDEAEKVETAAKAGLERTKATIATKKAKELEDQAKK